MEVGETIFDQVKKVVDECLVDVISARLDVGPFHFPGHLGASFDVLQVSADVVCAFGAQGNAADCKMSHFGGSGLVAKIE